MSLHIDFLAHHPEYVPAVAECCNSEWPWYYDNGNFEAALRYHKATAQLSGVPCALVALDGDVLAGTIALIEADLDLRPTLTPWLGCLYVWPQFRNKRVASRLIEAGIALAREQHIETLYAWTEVLSKSLQRCGWTLIEKLTYQQREIELYWTNPVLR